MKKIQVLSILTTALCALTVLSGCRANRQPSPESTYDLQNAEVEVYPIDLQYTEYAQFSVSTESDSTSPDDKITFPEGDLELPKGGLKIAEKDPPKSGGGSNPPPAEQQPDTEEQQPDTEEPASEPEDDEPEKKDSGKKKPGVGAPGGYSPGGGNAGGGDAGGGDAGNTTAPTSSSLPVAETTGDIAAVSYHVVVFRSAANDSGSRDLQFWLMEDEEATIFHGKLHADNNIEWASTEDVIAASSLNIDLADALSSELQWRSCVQDGVYAQNQNMTHCAVFDQNVIYAADSFAIFQIQSYDDAGLLLDATVLSWFDTQQLQDNAVSPISWSEDLFPTLQFENDNAATTPKQSNTALIIVSVIAGLLLVSNLFFLFHKPALSRIKKSVSSSSALQKTVGGVSFGTVHNIGNRSGQQDSFDVINCAAGTLAVVADGMGGLKDGDKVSQKIVSTMRADAVRIRPGKTDHVLCQMVSHVNQEVNRMLGTAKQYKCGSTLLAALVEKDTLQWITVGDSRIYLYRGGNLLQINREHIYCAELLERAINGKISFAEAMRDPQSDRLNSFIGMGELKHVDIGLNKLKLCANDRILLMSDGVFNTLNTEEIAAILRSTDDAAKAAALLEEKVLQKKIPNQDNFTCVILAV